MRYCISLYVQFHLRLFNLVDKRRGYQTCMFNYRIKHYNHFVDQIEAHFNHPSPSIHVAHSTGYSHKYIWSSYPSPKIAKIDYSALFSFDVLSAFLFPLCLVGAVALMKLFTCFGSKLGLDTVSEEPVNIPTRYHLCMKTQKS